MVKIDYHIIYSAHDVDRCRFLRGWWLMSVFLASERDTSKVIFKYLLSLGRLEI